MLDGVSEVVLPSVVAAREDDVKVGDWVVLTAVVVEEVVGRTEVSGVVVVDRLSVLEVAIITDDGVEDDIDDALAEVRETVDDGADGLADDGAAVVITVVVDIVDCMTLRAIHAEEPRKLNMNARRWLLRLF